MIKYKRYWVRSDLFCLQTSDSESENRQVGKVEKNKRVIISIRNNIYWNVNYQNYLYFSIYQKEWIFKAQVLN